MTDRQRYFYILAHKSATGLCKDILPDFKAKFGNRFTCAECTLACAPRGDYLASVKQKLSECEPENLAEDLVEILL